MKQITLVGFWSGILAFVFTISYCIVQVLQVSGIIHFPTDEILIYATSLGIVIPFLLAIICFHYITPADKKFWSHTALVFTIIYAVFVTANYVVQLATVVPMKLRGRLEEVQVLDQTPHSLFWNFDALGYIFMGMAMFAALPVFNKQGFERWVRLAFLANALVTPLICIVYFYPVYSTRLLMLGYPWALTAPAAMLMLALLFRQKNLADTWPGQGVHTNKAAAITNKKISF